LEFCAQTETLNKTAVVIHKPLFIPTTCLSLAPLQIGASNEGLYLV
jgi:hypothetical protein